MSPQDTACSAGRSDAPLTVAAAQLRALAAAAPVRATERISLDGAAGRILDQAVLARSALPPFDNSTMDGYAVRVSDLQGIVPWRLPKTATDDIAQGAAVYFDAAEGEVTQSNGSGSNPMVGHAVTAAGNPSATVAVRLSV